jgi:hypothetical protein
VKTSIPILKQRTFNSASDNKSSSHRTFIGMRVESGVSTLSTTTPRYFSANSAYILPRQGTSLVY